MNKNGVSDFDEGDWKSFYREINSNVETFTKLKFQEVSGLGNINFRLDEGGGGESGVPVFGVRDVETAVGINPDVAGAAAVVRLGTYSVTWFHEFGHALGLKHTHDAEEGLFPKLPGVVEPGDQGATYLNSQINTVMGYTSSFLSEDNPFTDAVDFGTQVNAQPGSFGAIDIAALQHLYGARAYNTGNDVYRFSDDVDFNKGYSTIWDTGGSDTIEYEGTSRAKIDLRAATLKDEIGGGGWISTSEPLTGGFTIANGVTIENAKGNVGDDILVGNDVANTLTGLAGNDVLRGNGGNDRLDGGEGDDTLVGGAGSDTAIYRNAFSSYTLRLEGDVTVITGEGVDRLETVETAIFSDGTYDLVGRVFSPTGTEPNPPADTLIGTDDGETLVATSGADWRLEGLGGHDSLIGNIGRDHLDGGDGNDRLDGGAGADTMIGGAGDDVFIVDNRGDVLVEEADGGFDVVESSISFTLSADFENLRLTGTGAISGTGNDRDNALFGNDAANVLTGGDGNDWLNGGGGVDRLVGGRGDDYYVVDNVRDAVTERAAEGTDHVESSVSFRLGANIENLYLVGSADIEGTGNELANILVGNSAANVLRGYAGNDILIGDGGNDRLIGDGGNDRLTGGAGIDELTGGAGRDVFIFRNGDTGSTRMAADRITDFQKGDVIDLSEIDRGGTIDLHFVGKAAFTGAIGDIRFAQANGSTFVEADLDGNRVADFVIALNGVQTLAAADFLL
ncbi:Ca2+-binding RTX toxin-like protein [Aureimonas pseudogalii]|uniref:Ca2+-binding RTX toxin-like protein n=2 Tax=Aureimonas pseudogalii TaxID=1744844 RepID=A0A7W6H2I3_9HYPH|nr:Ca2+-binding RTX toxin-like protein [Aureimonas pseudogalii]